MEGDDIINAMQSWHKNREECDEGFGIDISESTLRNKDEFEMNRLFQAFPGTSTSTMSWNASSMQCNHNYARRMWYENIVVQKLSTFISGFCLGGGVNTEASNCGAPGLCTSRGHTSI